jgi:hypothetical protein
MTASISVNDGSLSVDLRGLTNCPGVISAGRFYDHGSWVFWDVHDPTKAIAIALRDEHYSKLVIEVEDPANQVSIIRESIKRPPAQAGCKRSPMSLDAGTEGPAAGGHRSGSGGTGAARRRSAR